ncbi:MAG: sensor histidine kinase [Lachnospiraceae bacterium]|nr:sensor histidine kinase [Lachnospiraceae bacterium]
MKKIVIMTQEQLKKRIEQEIETYEKKRSEDYEKEILSRQIDVSALQGQINPHFLYNVLECIRGQALVYQVPEIADTTEALSKFFRYSINTRSDTVTILEELENVRNYIKIQQFRFKNRISLEILFDDQDNQVLSGLIPKLSLQPIVENAIEHGFAHKSEDNQICIEVIRTKKHVNIRVSDNGSGMSREKLEKLKEKMYAKALPDGGKDSMHNGIALYNVNRRLQLYFGEEYGMSVSSVENMGTDFEIYIPLKIGI